MTSRAAADAPPTVLEVELASICTPVPFGTLCDPVRSVPMSSPAMMTFDDPEVTQTPTMVFPEMTSPLPAVVPPMVSLGDAPTSTPVWFGIATVPVPSVPMKSPSTTVVIALVLMETPLLTFPEMTSRAEAVVPPTVLARARR